MADNHHSKPTDTRSQDVTGPRDPAAARTHLNCLFGRCAAEYPQGQIELRRLGGRLGPTSHCFPCVGGIDEAVDWAMLNNHEKHNVYVGVNPRKPDTVKFASADDIEIAFYQFADIDTADSVAILRAGSPVPYTFAVITGTTPHHPRPHLYWELEEPTRNLDAWRDIQRGLSDHFKSDAVIDPPRIMRLAGTINYPTTQKADQRGYITEAVTIRTENDDDRGDPVSAMAMRAAFPLAAAPDPLALFVTTGIDPVALGKDIQAGGEWHNKLLRLVGHWVATRRSDAEIQEDAAAYTLIGYTPQETAAEVDKMIQGARKKGWGAAPDAPDVRYTVQGGRSELGLKNAIAALGIEIRFDIRAQQEQFLDCKANVWEPLNDYAFDDIRARIAARCIYTTKTKGLQRLWFGRESFRSALNALFNYLGCDPFRDWLDALPGWDKTARLDTILCDLFSVPPDGLSAWAGRYVFVGAIQRTLHPGCRLDEVPVLVGKQGYGKSAFVREALPPEFPAWFSDQLDLAEDARRCAEVMDGCVLVEIAEMAGASRADLRKLKSFLTRRDDGKVRRAYARTTETCLRRSIFVATTDDQHSLPNDKAGNRRFVPVDLPQSGHVEPFMKTNRVQLWAEALYRFREEGLRANLPRELFAVQAVAVEAHRNASEGVENHCATFLSSRDGVTLAEMKADTAFTEYQIRDAATLLGFECAPRKRVDGKRVRLWIPPESSELQLL